MLRLLPLPIFIFIYLFSWWKCKENIIASDKQLKPCIDWAYIKNLPLPPKPSFVEFYISRKWATQNYSILKKRLAEGKVASVIEN